MWKATRREALKALALGPFLLSQRLQHLAGMKGVVCGAGGKYNTMPDERVELPQFRAATRLYALTAQAICG